MARNEVIMRESPAIAVNRNDLQRSEQNPLAYVAAIFNPTLTQWPQAQIVITGNGLVSNSAKELLSRVHGVPMSKVQINSVYLERNPDEIHISISYFPRRAGTRSVWVEFIPDLLGAAPFKVEFEASPDGAYIEEVKVQFEKLKAEIKTHARRGIQKIKFGTKLEGVAMFDREVSDKIKETIKLKVKGIFGMDVRLPGMANAVSVEFYGSIFSKLQADGPVKMGGEAGLTLTVPFNFL